MKKLIASVALFLVAAMAFAQDNHTIKMSIKIEGLPPEMASMGEQETVTYIKGEKMKTEISGMMMNQTILFDGKMYTLLMDMMGNKMGYTATKEELEAGNAKNEKAEKPKVEYTNEKKMIAGYECTKAIVTTLDKEKKEQKIIVWTTDKIKADLSKLKKAAGNNMELGDLKGYVMEMQADMSRGGQNMKMVLSATEVSSAPIDDAVFKVSTEGYKLSSYKETMDMMRSGMGGK